MEEDRTLSPIQEASINFDNRSASDEKHRHDMNKAGRTEPAIVRSSSSEPTESTDPSNIDVDKMTEQLRTVYKDIAEGESEKNNKMPGPKPAPHPSELDPKDNEIYKKALACVQTKKINGLGLECQRAMSEVLNVERDDYKDYRFVAESLGLPVASINVIEDLQNQMMKVFKQLGSRPAQELVDALMKWGRFDALEILTSFFPEQRGQFASSKSFENPPKPSMNESMFREQSQKKATAENAEADASCSSLVSPEASTQVYYDVTPHSSNSKDDDDDEWHEHDLKFWESISGDKKMKKLKDVKEAFKKKFENKNFGYIWKLIVHTLKLDPAGGGNQLVTAENFRRMLAFFSPAEKEDVDCCMKRAYELMKQSMTTMKISGESVKCSWLAGHMSSEDAEDRLLLQPNGTFLVRFSISNADKGWYVLAIKTKSHGVHEFRLEQFTDDDNKRKFRLLGNDLIFDSLPMLITHFREDGKVIDAEEKISEYLAKPCPNLPLNSICRGYTSATKTNSKGKKK
eukprot:gene17533-19283_t